jgi:hypothetical protein
MSHKQAKRLRRAEREATGACALDLRREADRLRYAKMDELREKRERHRREQFDEVRAILADRAKFHRMMDEIAAIGTAIVVKP